MRTTVEIPDETYKAVKRLAIEENTTVKQVLVSALETVLKSRATEKPRKPMLLPIVHSKNPGSLDLDNEKIYDLIGFP